MTPMLCSIKCISTTLLTMAKFLHDAPVHTILQKFVAIGSSAIQVAGPNRQKTTWRQFQSIPSETYSC